MPKAEVHYLLLILLEYHYSLLVLDKNMTTKYHLMLIGWLKIFLVNNML